MEQIINFWAVQNNLHWVSVIQDTVIFQLTKELNSKQTIEWHKEEEEQSNIIYLLTWAPRNKNSIFKSLSFPEVK